MERTEIFTLVQNNLEDEADALHDILAKLIEDVEAQTLNKVTVTVSYSL